MPGCLLAFIFLIAPAAAAANERVTFCFNDWPPYTQMTNDGAVGISVEIVKRAAALIDRQIQFVEREWNDCLQKVKKGEYDVILDAAERDAYLQGPTSFNQYSDTFWVSNNSNVSHYDQLTGLKLALVEGYVYDDRLMAHIENLGVEVVRGKDDPTNIQDLADGKVDATVSDLASTFVVTSRNKLQVHPILPPFSVDRLYASFNRDKPDLHRAFDRAFATLLEQGVVDEIYKAAIGTTYSSFDTY